MNKAIWIVGFSAFAGIASAQTFSATNTYEFDQGGSGAYYNGTQNWLELDSGGLSYVGQDFKLSGVTGTTTSVSFSEITAGAGLPGPDGTVHGNIYLADPSFDVVANESNINVDCPANLALENADGVDKRFSPILAGSFDIPGGIDTSTGAPFTLSLNLADPGVMAYLSNVESTNGTLRVIFAGDQSFYPTPQPNGLTLRFVGSKNGNYADPTLTIQTQPAPEPASLIGLGLVAAGVISRRRKKA